MTLNMPSAVGHMMGACNTHASCRRVPHALVPVHTLKGPCFNRMHNREIDQEALRMVGRRPWGF